MEELAAGEREGGAGVLGSGTMSGSVTHRAVISEKGRKVLRAAVVGFGGFGCGAFVFHVFGGGPPGRGAAWQGLSKETAHQSFCPSRSLKREISDLPSHPII